MRFFLKIKGDIIEDMKFITDGCGATIATASQTSLLVIGKTIDFALDLKPEDIDRSLGGLPDDHKHCAELEVRTLRRAIKNYQDLK